VFSASVTRSGYFLPCFLPLIRILIPGLSDEIRYDGPLLFVHLLFCFIVIMASLALPACTLGRQAVGGYFQIFSDSAEEFKE
jgi:hypothetical protein